MIQGGFLLRLRTFIYVTGGLSCLIVIVAVVLSVVENEGGRSRRKLEVDVPLDHIKDYVIENINPDNIRNFLRNMTRKPHLGGTDEETKLMQWVADTWQSQGLDQVHLVPYKVLLSYPDPVTPNLVRLVGPEGDAVWESSPKQKPLYAPEEAQPDLPFTFNGYAARGNVTGDPVYVYYGRNQDFDYLAQVGVDVSAKIVIARYGKVFRANIALTAQQRGAVGVVLFSDPADYAPQGPDFVYPHSYFMPPSAAPFGTVKLVDGDPLTPYYPATESAFRIPEEEAAIPKIPVQAISYEDAWQILSRMRGREAPAAWQGGLNVTYHLGPGFTLHHHLEDSLINTPAATSTHTRGLTLNLDVNNYRTLTTTHNVVGVITGREEPDRYIVLGNHLDAWILGAIDPNSGTAAMLELSRVFMLYRNLTDWRPRRSIVFLGWGAEEYGLVASTEWTEQFGKQLADRTIAYLNVDMAIEGNYTLRTKSAPLLTDAIFQSAKRIPNPDPEEMAAGRTSVYDTWVVRKPDPQLPGLPLMQFIGSGSDYKGFQHNLGIPCVDVRYTHDNRTLGEPSYHTLYETFEMVDEIYDKGFHFNQAVTALWGDLAVTLAESKILPFSLSVYADFISRAQQKLAQDYGQLIASQNISLEHFADAADKFNESIVAFNEALQHLDLNNPLAVRTVNDQLMMVEKAFIDPRGLPGRPDYNHVITAPSKGDAYSGTAFAGLIDTLVDIKEAPEDEREPHWRVFRHHLAAVTHLLYTAGKVLSNDLW